MFIELQQYLPDLPVFNNPGLTVAINVTPLTNGYGDVKDLTTITDALVDTCLGGMFVKDNDNTSMLFVGTEETLSVMDSSLTFTDISDDTYTTDADIGWHFAQYGRRMIATNYADDVRTYLMGTDTVASALYDGFKARYVGIVKDFVVYGYTNDDDDGEQPKRLRWTGIGDPTTIDISVTTQSDFQQLEGSGVGGAITGFVGGEYGIAIQENAIWRMTYIGSPAVFQFDEIEKESGTRYPNTVAGLGSTVIYLGKDGFKSFNGSVSTPAGAGKIDATFFADFDKTYFGRMSCAIDPTTKVYKLCYTSVNSPDGRPDKALFYNIITGAFSFADIRVEKLIPAFTTAITLDNLDNISSSLDALPLSLDSNAWAGGDFTLGAFSLAHKFGFFQGASLDAVLETAEYQPTDNGVTEVSTIRVMAEGADATIQIGHRYSAERTLVYSDEKVIDSYGKYHPRVTDTLVRARVNLYGGFRKIKGLDIQLIARGGR